MSVEVAEVVDTLFLLKEMMMNDLHLLYAQLQSYSLRRT